MIFGHSLQRTLTYYWNTVLFGNDFTPCKWYVAIECFGGNQMAPFSYLLCRRCNTIITCQILDFQILTFRLSWSIYDVFLRLKKHASSLLPPPHGHWNTPWFLTFLRDRKEIRNPYVALLVTKFFEENLRLLTDKSQDRWYMLLKSRAQLLSLSWRLTKDWVLLSPTGYKDLWKPINLSGLYIFLISQFRKLILLLLMLRVRWHNAYIKHVINAQ